MKQVRDDYTLRKEDKDMTLGQTIKYYRTKFNLSQSELGDQIGVSRQAVTKWETDTGIPDINNIQSLAKIFHISIDTLLLSDHHVQSLHESKNRTLNLRKLLL